MNTSARLVFSFLITASVLSAVRAQASSAEVQRVKAALIGFAGLRDIAKAVTGSEPSPIKEMLDENDCKKTAVMPGQQPPLQAGTMKVEKFSMQASGPGCPFTYLLQLDGVQMPDGFKATLTLSYEAHSAEAKALSDVTKMSFSGDLFATGTKKPNGQGGGAEFDFTFTGSGLSTAKGAFSGKKSFKGKIEVSVTPDPANPKGFPIISFDGGFGEQHVISFTDLTADLRRQVKFAGFAPQAEQTLNGSPVTDAEFNELSELMQLPGFDGFDQLVGGKGPDTSKQLRCEARVYRTSDVALADAEVRALKADWPASVAAHVGKWCGPGNGTQMAMAGKGDKLTMSYAPAETHAEMQTSLCPIGKSGAACLTASRFFLPGETKAYADALGSYTVVQRCEPAPTCP